MPETRAILSRSRLEQSLDVQVAQDRSQAENHGMDRVAGTSLTRNLPDSPDLVSGAKEEGEMERRRWSAHDLAKLQNMARKYPAKQIAAELGRGLSATMVKAHQLRISLRMKRHGEGMSPSADPGAAGFDFPREPN